MIIDPVFNDHDYGENQVPAKWPTEPVVSVDELIKFEREYFAGKFGTQRFGQAFLCQFSTSPEVRHAEHNSQLWEVKGVARAKQMMRDLGLIY